MNEFWANVTAFLVLGGVIFAAIYRDIKRSIEGKESKETIKKFYEYKKRQDEYDAIPVAVKRDWLRNYAKNKVSHLVKRFTGK